MTDTASIDIALADFVRGLPKAELHMHIEGSLEPELMFELAQRNGVTLPFASVDEIRAAYAFSNLQDFLDIYYQGAGVLQTAEDFKDLALAYFQRLAADGGAHAEIFFDPQTHTDRGVAFATVMEGLLTGMAEAEKTLGVTSKLIMCFLRHLSEEAAFETLEQAKPWPASAWTARRSGTRRPSSPASCRPRVTSASRSWPTLARKARPPMSGRPSTW
jgi:adenine deaminase